MDEHFCYSFSRQNENEIYYLLAGCGMRKGRRRNRGKKKGQQNKNPQVFVGERF